jgi:hypothetical protein
LGGSVAQPKAKASAATSNHTFFVIFPPAVRNLL